MYTKIPKNLKTDNVLPPISEIPSLITSLRHPRKNRSVSVGPQSEADAYEALAIQDRRRRESHSSASRMRQTTRDQAKSDNAYFSKTFPSKMPQELQITALPTPAPSQVDLHKALALPDVFLDEPMTPSTLASTVDTPARRLSEDRRQYEKDEREIFSLVEKPRVRYDVEVITKLIVYTGTIFCYLKYSTAD